MHRQPGPVTQKQLQQHLAVKPSTVNGIVDRLVEKGMLTLSLIHISKHWYDYLWICAILYFTLGFFNILFAWLGMIDFLLPLFLALSLIHI